MYGYCFDFDCKRRQRSSYTCKKEICECATGCPNQNPHYIHISEDFGKDCANLNTEKNNINKELKSKQ